MKDKLLALHNSRKEMHKRLVLGKIFGNSIGFVALLKFLSSILLD